MGGAPHGAAVACRGSLFGIPGSRPAAHTRAARVYRTVLWDGGRVHSKSKVVQAYLAKHPEIVAENLPAYAPELNPDEMVWGWSKNGRLANLAAENTDELAERVVDELAHLQTQPHLLASFLKKTKLAA